MSEFLSMLKARQNMDTMDGELFEVLASVGDFSVFKELILDFKEEKGGLGVDLSGLLQVTHKK